MKVTDPIYYDSIEVIYYTRHNKQCNAFAMNFEYTDIETYDDLIKHIQSKEEHKINSMIIIAERGLEGVVLRWNEADGLYQVGTTRGYA